MDELYAQAILKYLRTGRLVDPAIEARFRERKQILREQLQKGDSPNICFDPLREWLVDETD